MSSAQMHALLARRREMELMRHQETVAVSKYYDHWDKVTSRHQNWAAPEYYKKADEQQRKKKERENKELSLKIRQGQLDELYKKENCAYEEEIESRCKKRSKFNSLSSEMLEKIQKNTKERESARRKLELEAKLYGYWRNGVADESRLFDAKTDNQVLARLNWLDKKVEEQMQREKDEANAQEQKLRLQEEIRKTEEMRRARQLIREEEIKEVRALQESHMDQLKQEQLLADRLKDQETKLRTSLDDLNKELELLAESSLRTSQSIQQQGDNMNNLKKIKSLIRKRSEFFCGLLKLYTDILERVGTYVAPGSTTIPALLQKYHQDYEAEMYRLPEIDALYESEAKVTLLSCEELWQAQFLERHAAVKAVLDGEKARTVEKIDDNLQRQNDSLEIRSMHLTSIENSNEKLKKLFNEEEHEVMEESEGGNAVVRPHEKYTEVVSAPLAAARVDDNVQSESSVVPRVSQSFSNLNLNNDRDTLSLHDGSQLGKEGNGHGWTPSSLAVSSGTSVRPRYGRKRVTWT